MHIERIKFERSGGFAGIILKADIKMDDLPDDQKKQILELLDDVDFEELPEQVAGKMPVPDDFVYSIVVESEQKEYKVMAGESALPDDMQPLLKMLEKEAIRQARNR